MTDVETLDTATTAVVFQIGLVIFAENGHILHRMVYNIDVTDQLDNHRTVSASTLKFWTDPKISEGIHHSMTSARRGTVATLALMTRLLDSYDISEYWSKGDFDYKILTHLYHHCELESPFTKPWFKLRELRTLMKECGVKPNREVTHDALDDCMNQIDSLKECRNIIKHGTHC